MPGSPATVTFYDRIPRALAERLPKGDALVAAYRHGFDLARKGRKLDTTICLYDDKDRVAVRLTLPTKLFRQAAILSERDHIARRRITVAALHFGLTDPYSPGHPAAPTAP